MHLTVSSKGMLLKWVIPVILVVAMLGFFGLRAWGGSGGGLDDVELTDFNPAYQSNVIGPAEGATGPGGVFVLYSIEVAEQTNVIPQGSGTLALVTVTNNIAEPIANGSYGSVIVTKNGDIRGNVVVTADVFMPIPPAVEGVLVYTDLTPPDSVTIMTIPDIIIHPGKSVVFQVPVLVPTLVAPMVVNVKAEYVGATTNF
jgi:hypothetical protein